MVEGRDHLPDEILYGRTGYLYSLLLLHSLQVTVGAVAICISIIDSVGSLRIWDRMHKTYESPKSLS